MTRPSEEPTPEKIAQELRADEVHYLRRVAFCELMRDDYKRRHSRSLHAWALGAQTGKRATKRAKLLFGKLVDYDNGSVFNDLGRAVAEVLARKAASHG